MSWHGLGLPAREALALAAHELHAVGVAGIPQRLEERDGASNRRRAAQLGPSDKRGDEEAESRPREYGMRPVQGEVSGADRLPHLGHAVGVPRKHPVVVRFREHVGNYEADHVRGQRDRGQHKGGGPISCRIHRGECSRRCDHQPDPADVLDRRMP